MVFFCILQEKIMGFDLLPKLGQMAFSDSTTYDPPEWRKDLVQRY